MECGEVGKDHGVSSKRSNLSRALRNDDELREEDSLDRKSSEAEGWERSKGMECLWNHRNIPEHDVR